MDDCVFNPERSFETGVLLELKQKMKWLGQIELTEEKGLGHRE